MILHLGQEVTEILLLTLLPLTLQDLTIITTAAAAEEEEEEATRVTITIRPVVIVMADVTLDVIQDVEVEVEVDMVMTVVVTTGPRTEAAEIVMDHRPIHPTRAVDIAATTVSVMFIIHCCVMAGNQKKNTPLC